MKGSEVGIGGTLRFKASKALLENNSLHDVVLSMLGNWKDNSVLALEDVGSNIELFRGSDISRISVERNSLASYPV